MRRKKGGKGRGQADDGRLYCVGFGNDRAESEIG